MKAAPKFFFLPTGGEQRLCVFHAPVGTPRGRVLYVHPFAEEMNKSRRMVALSCSAMASAGFAVLQIDLRGCGDSSADFGDASWADWQADVRLALDWLDHHVPEIPLWIWSLRVGSLIAATDWGRQINHLFWQPVTNGKSALQQFLRLKLAANLAGGASKGLMDQMKSELTAGRAVEVAGYVLGAPLASGLEGAKASPAGSPGRLEWLEVSTREDASLSPVSEAAVQAWAQCGWQARSAVVQGPSFWTSTEIEIAPALIAASIEALS